MCGQRMPRCKPQGFTSIHKLFVFLDGRVDNDVSDFVPKSVYPQTTHAVNNSSILIIGHCSLIIAYSPVVLLYLLYPPKSPFCRVKRDFFYVTYLNHPNHHNMHAYLRNSFMPLKTKTPFAGVFAGRGRWIRTTVFYSRDRRPTTRRSRSVLVNILAR